MEVCSGSERQLEKRPRVRRYRVPSLQRRVFLNADESLSPHRQIRSDRLPLSVLAENERKSRIRGKTWLIDGLRWSRALSEGTVVPPVSNSLVAEREKAGLRQYD